MTNNKQIKLENKVGVSTLLSEEEGARRVIDAQEKSKYNLVRLAIGAAITGALVLTGVVLYDIYKNHLGAITTYNTLTSEARK
jgi:hypothetical protein